MRGKRTWRAWTPSVNKVNLSFPYEGGTYVRVSIKQSEDEAPNEWQPVLHLQNGQLDCSNLCYLSVKFDDGPVMDVVGGEDTCGDHDCVPLNLREGAADEMNGFLRRLRASKRMTIEVPIYNFGAYQFEFDTEGLVWPQPGAPTKEHAVGDTPTKHTPTT